MQQETESWGWWHSRATRGQAFILFYFLPRLLVPLMIRDLCGYRVF